MIQELNPQTVAAGVTFLLGVFDALRRYRRDGDIKLHQLPWIEFRALFELGRRAFFTIDKPDHPSFVLEGYSVDQLTRELGKQGVKPRHRFSLVYRGEVYNGVLAYFDPDRGLPHRQIHVRAFDHPDGLEIQAHEEPHWYGHPIEHLKSNDMEFRRANEWVQKRLYEKVPVGYPDN